MSHSGIEIDKEQWSGPPPCIRRETESEWSLVGKTDQGTGRRTICISAIPFRIGRCDGLSLTIRNPTVSSVHAEIDVSDIGLVVRDLASTNGTFVNGNRVSSEALLVENDVVQFADVTLRLQRDPGASDVRRTTATNSGDRAAALLHFDQLFDDQEAATWFQPIVCLDTRQTVGYEVLARSRLSGLTTPQEMFTVASQLGLEVELSRCIRQNGISVAKVMGTEANLFVNIHPSELNVAGLATSLHQMRSQAGDRPLTLEIHEAAMTDVSSMLELRATLCDLNIQLAYDDFGAGQARLIDKSWLP